VGLATHYGLPHHIQKISFKKQIKARPAKPSEQEKNLKLHEKNTFVYNCFNSSS